MKRITLMIFTVLISWISFAQTATCVPTNVVSVASFNITTDVVLLKSGSPYKICGETTIEETGSLTLEPGVELFVNDQLIVKGEFIASGTELDSIFISSSNDGVLKEKKILLDVEGLGSLKFDYVKSNLETEWLTSFDVNQESEIKNSSFYKFKTQLTDLPVSGKHYLNVEACKFEGSQVSILNRIIDSEFKSSEASAILVQNNRFEDCYGACYVGGGGFGEEVLDNYFLNCTEGIISVGDGGFTIRGNQFENVSLCINIWGSADDLIVESNDFCNEGITLAFNSVTVPVDFSCNTWCAEEENIKFRLAETEFGFDTPGADQAVTLGGCVTDDPCLPSTISSTLTLTKEFSPYTVCDKTVITETGQLILEPGVEISLSTADSEIEVRGKLEMVGNAIDSVFYYTDHGLPIQVIENGQIIMDYVSQRAGSTAEFLFVNSENNHSISNSSFIGNSLAIKAWGKGILNVCSSIFLPMNNQGFQGVNIINMPGSTITNCLFEKISKGVISDGEHRIYNNRFINLQTINGISSFGIAMQGNTEAYNNTFETNEIAISVLGTVIIQKNRFEDNDLGISFDNSLSSSEMIIVQENSFCDNVVDFGLESTGTSLLNNCFCLSSSDDICDSGYKEGQSCDGNVIIDTTLYFSIEGLAHTGNSLLSEGTAFLYSSEDIGFAPIAIDTITEGVFNFEKIDSGLYTILVVPNDDEGYEGTYYVNKPSITNANTIQVYGDIAGLDIRLNEVDDFQIIGSIDHVLELDKEDLEDGTYPVLISEKEDDVNSQYYWSIATTTDGLMTLSLEGLNPNDYEITIPTNGFKNFDFCLIYGNGDFTVDESCIISGIGRESVTDKFFISPNPTLGNLHVDVLSIGEYRIVNSFGVVVREGIFEELNNDLDISDLQNGVYFMSVSSKSGFATDSFMKME